MKLDWNALLMAVIGLAGSGGIASIITSFLNRYWIKHDKNNVVAEALKVLMAHEIRCIGSSYVYAQEISLDDKETLDRMYKAYMALPGADGLCGTVMEEVGKLRVVKQPD